MLSRFAALLMTFGLAPLIAQSPGAILVDGPGPWRDDRWALAVTEFSGLLSDSGYLVTTVSPVDLPSVLGPISTNSPGALLAVPSLESLPATALNAIVMHLNFGANLMASGGEPFRDPLYLTPDGNWLDAAAYQAALGTAPPQAFGAPPHFGTLSPSSEQFTNSAGLRVPIPRGRGISAVSDQDGRCRFIGDFQSPAATVFVPNTPLFLNGNLIITQANIVWLPWPQIFDPQRAELVSALRGIRLGLHLTSAGPSQILWLPGEDVTGSANIINTSNGPVQATIEWSISGSSGIIPQAAISVATNTGGATIPLDMGQLASGDYTLTFHLMAGDQEVDRIDSPVRVLDPTLSRQPDQKIRVQNGAFYAGGQRVFLEGVNYWPRNTPSLSIADFNSYSWLDPLFYDPGFIEADLSLIASLHFNLVNIRYSLLPNDWPQQARALIDFLERCRAHGIWVRIDVPATRSNNAYAGDFNAPLESYLEAAYLPGNDRVFSYELLWEPFLGPQNQGGYGGFVNGTYESNVGRAIIDPDWRNWVNDQYGSLANAQQVWGIAPPLDNSGQLTNPLDTQIENDGPWRIMVAAYRRFVDDYFGRNLGVIAREIRRTDPDTLLSYRNWATMTETHNSQMGYDIGTAAAHLDFFSPENYDGSPTWPDDRKWGLVTAYSRYRTGGKPVQWTEFGADIGPNYGTPASRAAQATLCDTIMRQVNDDGSNAATVWWWPGGSNPTDQSDFGIIDPDGTPRDCASNMAQWAMTFAAAPPDLGPGSPLTLTVDRDADARGQYGVFLNWQNSYVQGRQAGQPVVLVDQGTGTDTSTMPLIQVGNAPYTGLGPLKFANAEFGGIHIVCPSLDVTVENGSQVQIPSGAACQFTPTLVNTGEAQWLPTAASKGGVLLHTNIGDVPLTSSVPALQRILMGSLAVTMGQSTINLSGRMRAPDSDDFGEVLNLALIVDSTVTGSCAISLSPTSAVSAPAGGVNGTISVTAAAGCNWTASSPQPWVTLTPGAGSGSAQVAYAIPANTGPLRQTTITIAGHPFTVVQAAAANPGSVQPPNLSQTNLNFGSQTTGTASAALNVTLTNTASGTLNLASVSIGGPNGADFTQTNTCGSSIATSATCSISITFVPSGVGARMASLFITGNISGGPLAISLSGTGTGTNPNPVIQAIVDSWGYTAGIAPGLWVAIGGTNMAGPPQSWNLSGVEQLPTTLAGVTVTFNGTPAALAYVSATQINALVPASLTPGPVQVVVEVNGVSSSPFTIAATATHPAIYAPANSDGSIFFVTAALQGTGFLVGNSATDSRVARAVFPGDVLDLYMIGLGATADPSKFITDKVFTGAFPVSANVAATVGGEPAPVIFAGLTSPGLYLVRISIPPDLAPGPQPIQVSTGSTSAGGAQTRSSLVLMIGAAPPNLVQNGSFESALIGTWNFNVDASLGAAATIQRTTSTEVDGVFSVQVTVTSATTNQTNAGAVQLSQMGLPLQQGQIYRLQFWAKADAAQTIAFALAGNGVNSQNYGLNSSVLLSGTWQQYVFYFQTTATDPAAQLDFYFGDQTGNIWLDAVALEGTSQ